MLTFRACVLVVFLTMACGGESASPPADAGSDVAATEAGGGCSLSAGDMRLACGGGVDACFGVNDAGAIRGGGNIRGCLGDNHCRPIPPPCGVCPNGVQLWRQADIDAFNRAAAAADGGACPVVGDGGVADVMF